MTAKRDLTSIKDLTKEDLQDILRLTKDLKSNPLLKSKSLLHKSIALIFAKPSLRTRVSFEVGINQLGGHSFTIKMDEIKIGSREDVKDTANVLSRYLNAIIIRTFEQKEVEDLAKFSKIPIINGLSNEEHPCQVISDIFTVGELFPNRNNLKLAYIGDGNNVAHSLLLGCALADINISIATPSGYEPDRKYFEKAQSLNPCVKINLTNDPSEASQNAHVIYTDVWASMGQEKEKSERLKIFKPFQINEKILSHASNDAVVFHCLPAHKGEEISAGIFEKFSNIIYKQAENRLHAQKAILLKITGAD